MRILKLIGVLFLLYFLSTVLSTYLWYMSPTTERSGLNIICFIVLAGIYSLIYSIRAGKKAKEENNIEQTNDGIPDKSFSGSEVLNIGENRDKESSSSLAKSPIVTNTSRDEKNKSVSTESSSNLRRDEPEDIQLMLNAFLGELNESFPNKVIIWSMWNHEQWDKKANYLRKSLEYKSGIAFLEAYGFKIITENSDSRLFCRKCGKKIPVDSAFCPYCGEKT